jgi:methionine sulfoxide reductase heme-binding subunit
VGGARVTAADPGLFLWFLARVAGLSAFVALSLALLTGVALRTAVLSWAGSNRALEAVHEFTTVLWMPLGAVHVVSLLGDPTARVGPLDVLVPFRAASGTVPVGLGTLSLLLLAVVAVAAWGRRRLPAPAWQWLHRLSYVAFGLLFAHALTGGTDFGTPVVSAATWGIGALLAVLAAARALWGRLPG